MFLSLGDKKDDVVEDKRVDVFKESSELGLSLRLQSQMEMDMEQNGSSKSVQQTRLIHNNNRKARVSVRARCQTATVRHFPPYSFFLIINF